MNVAFLISRAKRKLREAADVIPTTVWGILAGQIKWSETHCSRQLLVNN